MEDSKILFVLHKLLSQIISSVAAHHEVETGILHLVIIHFSPEMVFRSAAACRILFALLDEVLSVGTAPQLTNSSKPRSSSA